MCAGICLTDGVVTIRAPRPGDAALLVAGRDAEFHRFLGPGSPAPDPTACIEISGDVVGWVDADPAVAVLADGEINIGYHVFAAHRGRGYGARAVSLLLEQLRRCDAANVAVALIDPANERSIRLALRTGFRAAGETQSQLRFQLQLRELPPAAEERPRS